MAEERSLGDTFGHLRITDLARDAGLTSGAFYHYWDGQDAYREEVLAAVLDGPRSDADLDLLDPGDGGTEGVDRVARRVLSALDDDREHRLELALWAHDDDRAHPRLLARAREADAAFTHVVGHCLRRAARRPAPGWDLGAIGTAAVTLSDGLRTLKLIDPEALAGVGVLTTPGTLGLLLLVGASQDGTPAAVTAPPVPAPAGHQAGNARRADLLRLGVDLVRDRPTGNAFDHIRAEDVARRLGLTAGAFYHYWETQDAYRDDLIDALFAAERYVDPRAISGEDARIAEAEDLDAAIRDATTWYWSVAGDHVDNRVQFAFHTLDDPYVTPRLAAWNRDLRAAWHTVVDHLLDRFERRLRSPLGVELLVLGMSASLDGLIVRHGLDPTGLGPDDDGWTRWGRVCRALVVAGSAAVGDDRDLPTSAGEALRA